MSTDTLAIADNAPFTFSRIAGHPAAVIEASDIGLRGWWPRWVMVGELRYGNPRRVMHGGDLGVVIYTERDGVSELHILND